MALTDPLSIRQIEVFVALIEQESFTRAAKHLQLSQSTVSGHVADLERRLGVRLVDRERRGVKPTAAGRALLRPAREVLQAERAARMSVEELAGLLRGSLVVGGSTIPASYVIPGLFARFHAEHPAIRLRLETGDSGEILTRVRDADIEIAVIGAAPSGGDLESHTVGADELKLVVAPSHRLAGKTVAIDAILGVPVVSREPGSGTRAATERALDGLLPADAESITIACEVGSNEAQKAAVRAGLGIAFMSNLAVRDNVAHGTLAEVKLKGFKVERSFHLVCRQPELLSPAARAFRALAIGQK